MLKLFLNHASEDKALVVPYVEKLKALGHDPWLDKRLLPGQEWDEEIQHAFKSSDVVLIFMSPRSVQKRGYVQREIRDALERLKSLLPGDIGVIPLMLEECAVPQHISRVLQYIRIPNEWHKVVESLALASKQRQIAINDGLPMGPFRVYPRAEVLEWSGVPGYTLDLRFPHFESVTLSNTALELNDYVTAKRFDCLLEARRTKLEQDPERFKRWFTSEGETPANDLYCSMEPILVGESILSMILYESGFFAGAAHGFHGTTTHNFVIKDDGLVKLMLEDFFFEPFLTCPRFTELCIEKISKEWEERFESPPSTDDKAEIVRSFPPEWDTYRHYSLSSTGINVYFPPYTLGGYAAGSWHAEFSFEELGPLLKHDGPHLLAWKAHAVEFVHPDSGRPDEEQE